MTIEIFIKKLIEQLEKFDYRYILNAFLILLIPIIKIKLLADA